jgi:predicted Zn-dependent protease with MMP-like domain
LDREIFERLVAEALEGMPEEFRDSLDNVAIVVQDWPTRRQMAGAGVRSRFGLLGLYEGVPQVERGQGYNLVLPDRVTLFQRPIEAQCRTPDEVRREIRDVVCHEIAHHFGSSEDTLRAIEHRHRSRRRPAP